MRWLIDGYNVMHGGGRLGPKLGREGFRRARRQFLDELAGALGPFVSVETTVVFDATVPPGDFPTKSSYRGLEVLFALGDENADARIEQLITEHANPKSLTVVSSDNRIRLAASRRRTRSLTTEKFWELLDDLKDGRARKEADRSKPAAPSPIRKAEDPAGEAAYWLGVFGDIDESPELRQATSPSQSLLTDAELEEIQREIDREP